MHKRKESSSGAGENRKEPKLSDLFEDAAPPPTLPSEIWAHVFPFINDKRDIKLVLRVCTTWRDLIVEEVLFLAQKLNETDSKMFYQLAILSYQNVQEVAELMERVYNSNLPWAEESCHLFWSKFGATWSIPKLVSLIHSPDVLTPVCDLPWPLETKKLVLYDTIRNPETETDACAMANILFGDSPDELITFAMGWPAAVCKEFFTRLVKHCCDHANSTLLQQFLCSPVLDLKESWDLLELVDSDHLQHNCFILMVPAHVERLLRLPKWAFLFAMKHPDLVMRNSLLEFLLSHPSLTKEGQLFTKTGRTYSPVFYDDEQQVAICGQNNLDLIQNLLATAFPLPS